MDEVWEDLSTGASCLQSQGAPPPPQGGLNPEAPQTPPLLGFPCGLCQPVPQGMGAGLKVPGFWSRLQPSGDRPHPGARPELPT